MDSMSDGTDVNDKAAVPEREETAPSNVSPATQDLPEAAKRALAEAEARRNAYRSAEAERPKEIGGRGGNDPNRYGDWEIKGLTSDF